MCDSPGAVLAKPKQRAEVTLRPGRVVAIDSEALGIAALLLGAGRRTKDDVIDPAAGLLVDAYLGEVIEPGAPAQIQMHHGLSPEDGRVQEARAMIEHAFVIESADKPAPALRTSRVIEVLR